MAVNTIDLMNRGMDCLVKTLGVVEAEQFISVIKKEQFDYTEWQRNHYDEMKPDEFHNNSLEYAKLHPYSGNATRL